MSYSDCDQYQFGFKKGHCTTFCAGIVKHSIDYYISTDNFGVLARCSKFFWSSCGGPIFVGDPLRPNMLNMPKSASGFQCRNTCVYRSLDVDNDSVTDSLLNQSTLNLLEQFYLMKLIGSRRGLCCSSCCCTCERYASWQL